MGDAVAAAGDSGKNGQLGEGARQLSQAVVVKVQSHQASHLIHGGWQTGQLIPTQH